MGRGVDPDVQTQLKVKASVPGRDPNLLVQGENLAVMNRLEPRFAGRIKLVYIDPPFNIGNPSPHYEDHSDREAWLAMMEPRLEVLRRFLRPDDGVIFVHIDHRRLAELKLLMDRVFGEDNQVSLITVKVKDPAGVGQQSLIFDVCEYLLVYAADLAGLRRRGLEMGEDEAPMPGRVKGYDRAVVDFGEPRLVKTLQRPRVGEIRIQRCEDAVIRRFKKSDPLPEYLASFDTLFADYNPGGGMIRAIRHELPARGLCFMEYTPSKGRDAGRLTRVYFVNRRILAWLRDTARADGDGVRRRRRLTNLWEVPNAQLHAEGGVEFKLSKKPEALLKRVIEAGSAPGEWVLDCFLGSGTTAAVAHKLGRRWIGIEEGPHADTVCRPRLERVVSGEDRSGVSREVGWTGGGEFGYHLLKDLK